MTNITRLLSLTFCLLLLVAPQAQAQPPVKVAGSNPKANFVFAVDVSHTMWDPSGNGFRRYQNIRNLVAINGPLDRFKYDFNYGYFAYTGARTFPNVAPGTTLGAGNADNNNRHAQIVDDRAWHTPMYPSTAANPNTVASYNSLRDRLQNTYVYNNCTGNSGKGWSAQGCREYTTRGGVVAGVRALTPNGAMPAFKLQEKAALEKILDYYANPANSPAGGMFIPTLQTSSTGVTFTSTPCDAGHPDAPVGGPFAADGSANMTMCGATPCFNGWHRAYIDQFVMTGIPLDTFDFYFELFHELGYWDWPRYLGQPTDAEVKTDFCDRLDTPFANMKSKLDDCLTPGANSDRFWAGGGFTCNETTLANTICNGSGPNGGSPFFTENTCVCFPMAAGCGMGAALPDDCSVISGGVDIPQHMNAVPANGENPAPGAVFASSSLIRPYVQAEAMCYSERPRVFLNYQSSVTKAEPMFRTNLRDQPGNVLGGGSKCRDNVIGFLTDGTGGSGVGVTNHAAMSQWVYKSLNRGGLTTYPENHVFHATERAVGYDFSYVANADAMADTISGGVRTTAHNMARPNLTVAALAGILNRTQAGQYSSAPLVTDRFATRVGVVSHEIPGRYDSATDFSKYLGRPSRLSWYTLNDDGTLGALKWETDWKSLTDLWPGGPLSTAYTTRFFYSGSGSAVSLPAAGTHNVGMNAQWSATHTTGGNGWTRFRTIPANTTDRNGDGVLTVADNHPVLAWGSMVGADNAKPVVVEAPIDPPGVGSPDFRNFADDPDVRVRPRVVYVQANEFVHAINAGTRVAGGTLNTQLGGLSQTREFDYNDNAAAVAGGPGTEIWRYRPGFLDTAPNLSLGNAMHVPLMNGSLVTRDVKWRPALVGAAKYATLLAITQGAGGRGLALLDISKPHMDLGTNAAFSTNAGTKKVVFDGLLDATDVVSTTADPQIIDWPGANATASDRVALVMTSGWTATPGAGTPKKILVYQLTNRPGNNLQAGNTNTLTEIAIPVGAATTLLPSGARCVSFGKAFACYTLDSTGQLWRALVNVGTGAFVPGSATNITFDAGGGVTSTRVYNSLPAFYFSSDNALNVVFGSGNPDTLRTSEVGDRIYRIRDATLSGGSAAYLTTEVCKDSAGSTSGIIPLGANERLLTNPIISGGVVAWTTYRPPTTECGIGTSQLYAMDFQTCANAVDGVPSLRPVPQNIGDGVPSSPSVLGRSGTVVAHTSKQVDAAGINGSVTKVNTRGFLRKPIQRVYRLWWRRKAL